MRQPAPHQSRRLPRSPHPKVRLNLIITFFLVKIKEVYRNDRDRKNSKLYQENENYE